MTSADDEAWMQLAYAQAVEAAARGEVPIGAVVVDDHGAVCAQTGNRCVELSDPTAHAEILALREAGGKLGNYRLPGVTLYVTLEPCVMCIGAMIHARIARLVFAAPDPKTGAVASKYQIGRDGLLNHTLQITSGLLADQCSALLTAFFRARRTVPGETKIYS